MQTSFEPEDLTLMGTACDQAWAILQTALLFPSGEYQRNIRSQMAVRVMAALADGERDPDQLESIALG
jgi:GAF domain-containing protein